MSDVEGLAEVIGAHIPADDWHCSCGEDLFGGSAGYSWELFKSHVAGRLAARVQAARAEAAEVVESYRRKNPMNGDGSNYTIDRILRELVGEDERDRLKSEHQTRWNEEYLEFTARAAALRADDAGGEGL